MSEQVTGSIVPGTGTFSVTTTPATNVNANDGKIAPASGKPLPPEAVQAHIDAVVEELNRTSHAIGRDVRFEVDLGSGTSVIQVLDSETGEIIRQIPPEKIAPHFVTSGQLAMRLLDELA